MRSLELLLDQYALADTAEILTPALVIYPNHITANIEAGLRLMGNDPDRWRPHVKTVKLPHVIRMLVEHGVHAFKCATTLELLMCCETGARDVLFAIPAIGKTVRRIGEIAREFKDVRIAVLVEAEAQLRAALEQKLDIFIDINPGMNRTGVSEERNDEIKRLAQLAGERFKGLHFYDGQISAGSLAERQVQAQSGYKKLIGIVDSLRLPVEEVITSGTPAAPAAMNFPGFAGKSFRHRVSPGTILFNDFNSLRQLPDMGFVPAALVIATVVSHPAPGIVTCDAGHKGLSVDSGVPNCSVVGWPDLEPLKPSEEHLPIRVPEGCRVPAIGEHLYLLPKHICPTVNLYDEALTVNAGKADEFWQIRARGHEPALV